MATKKKQKKSNNGPIVGLMVVAVLGLGALAAYVKYGGASKVPPEMQRVPNLQRPSSKNEHSTVDLVTPSRNGTELKLDKHQSDVPAGEDPRLFALNHYLRQSKIMPADAKAIGIQVKDGVALIDVTPSFNQSFGSLDEEALLKGMTTTLAQFKEIQKVQFFSEGKVVSSLGNVDLSEPIPVRSDSVASNSSQP